MCALYTRISVVPGFWVVRILRRAKEKFSRMRYRPFRTTIERKNEAGLKYLRSCRDNAHAPRTQRCCFNSLLATMTKCTTYEEKMVSSVCFSIAIYGNISILKSKVAIIVIISLKQLYFYILFAYEHIFLRIVLVYIFNIF